MNTKKRLHTYSFILLMAICTIFAVPAHISADSTTYQTSASINRSAGTYSYTVKGIDTTATSSLTLQVTSKTTKKVVYTKDITLDSTNCVDGTYNGSFSLSDVKNTFDQYSAAVKIGDTTLSLTDCDFSIHKSNIQLAVAGTDSASSRNVTMTSKEASGGVLVPGKNNQVAIYAWPSNTAETSAVEIGAKQSVAGSSLSWTCDVSKAGKAYGKWNVKLVLISNGTTTTLASSSYNVAPSVTTFATKKTKALEKKKSFSINISGLKNTYGVSKVAFEIYNSKGVKVTTITGTKKNTSGSQITATVTMKKLKYALDNYTIKAVLTDSNGSVQTLSQTASANQHVQKGSFSVTKKSNATCKYKLSNVYVPGYFKNVTVTIYRVKGKKTKKLGSYKAKASSNKKNYTLTASNATTGKYKVKVYGTTTWKKKILLHTESFTLKKKDMGKNGWYYEKYRGKKYKFYYVNNVKQTDLTKVLKLKKSSSSNTNNFYIEVNRAACVVTIYMKNDETGKYDIPVKTCTVSVGRDTSTVAGSGGLHVHSSYTPIGTYSICTNGQSVKYTLKPMNEPDGSVVYARWATHIVGNVYFHAIAVGSQSHYALSSYTYSRLGYAVSAGCIRMTVADAKWIYDYASTGSTVKIVKGNRKYPGPLGKLPIIKSRVNYDPTDPAVPLSRKKADYKAKRISGYIKKNGTKVGC
ncbi:MAG: L,D-transpeptidase [Eubacterium sp.]|nr:L,D-transpeptidase [Eubacterium sp.]